MGRPFEKTPIFEGRSIDPLLFSPLLFLITNEKTIFLAKFEKIHPRFSRFPPSKMPRKNKQKRERERAEWFVKGESRGRVAAERLESKKLR